MPETVTFDNKTEIPTIHGLINESVVYTKFRQEPGNFSFIHLPETAMNGTTQLYVAVVHNNSVKYVLL